MAIKATPRASTTESEELLRYDEVIKNGTGDVGDTTSYRQANGHGHGHQRLLIEQFYTSIADAAASAHRLP